MNQCRPHISSDTCDVKERERQKPDQCALTCGALPVMPSNSVPPVCNQLRVPASPPPRLASRQHLSAAGEGLSTEYNKHPQPLFRKNFTSSRKKGFSPIPRALRPSRALACTFRLAPRAPWGPILRIPALSPRREMGLAAPPVPGRGEVRLAAGPLCAKEGAVAPVALCPRVRPLPLILRWQNATFGGRSRRTSWPSQ